MSFFPHRPVLSFRISKTEEDSGPPFLTTPDYNKTAVVSTESLRRNVPRRHADGRAHAQEKRPLTKEMHWASGQQVKAPIRRSSPCTCKSTSPPHAALLEVWQPARYEYRGLRPMEVWGEKINRIPEYGHTPLLEQTPIRTKLKACLPDSRKYTQNFSNRGFPYQRWSILFRRLTSSTVSKEHLAPACQKSEGSSLVVSPFDTNGIPRCS